MNLRKSIFPWTALIAVTVSFLQAQASGNLDLLRTRLAEAGTSQDRILLTAQIAQVLAFSHPDSAIAIAQSALDSSRLLQFRKGEAATLNAIGGAFFTKSEYRIALERFKEAMIIARELNDNELLAAGYLNFGNISYYQSDKEHAKEQFLKSLELGQKARDKGVMAKASVNLGAIAISEQRFTDGLQYLKKASGYFTDLYDRKGLAYCYRNIAVAYQMLGDRDGALRYLNLSLDLAEDIHNLELASGCLQTIADIHRQNGNYSKSVVYGLRSLALARRLNDLPYIQGAASTLAALYVAMNDNKNALKYTILAHAAEDSIHNASKNKELRSLQHRFEMEAKQHEIDLLEQKSGNQRMMMFVMLIGTFAVLVVALVIYRSLKRTRAAKLRLVAINQDKQRLITELTEAMESIRTLGELLPVCSNCKSVRDDKGYWQAVDRYISAHTDTKISHGICPECIKKLYPQYADRIIHTMAK